jgi:hypothetical protein
VAVLEGASITREQFLLKEMRTTCRLYLEDPSVDAVVEAIKSNNLFQYPTEKMLGNIARVCCKRINAANSQDIIVLIAEGQKLESSQANLYAMMCTYPLVYNFMTELVGQKYSTLDYSLSQLDMNSYITQLQYDYDNIASLSELTIAKIKQVLRKGLIECGMLASPRSTELLPIYLEPSVKRAILNKGDIRALMAFNCQDVN